MTASRFSARAIARRGMHAMLLAVALGGAACARPSAPNLVLIVIDTLRADHVGAYGYARAQTPRLDGLAGRGTRFAIARATTSWTLPSVTSILTGRYPVDHGAERLVSVVNDRRTLIAEVLASAGYETAAFSANTSLVIPESGLAQGFERFDVIEAKPGTGAADTLPMRDGTNRASSPAPADQLTDAALAWLGARADARRPYFLYVHYFDPHASYSPPPAYAAKFGVAADDPLLGAAQAMVMAGRKLPEAPQIETLKALYDAEIAFTDHELGRLLDALRLDDGRTIVMVTADHGEEFGDHGGFLHGRTLYEEMLHVPLLVAGGALPSGRVVEAPVSLVSVYPTLAELGGASAPPGAAGPSLVAALHGGAPAAATLFADLSSRTSVHRAAVIDGTWKMMQNRMFEPQLYDLATDPAESKPKREGEQRRITSMQQQLNEHNKAGYRARGEGPPQQRVLDADRRERLRQLGYVE